LTDGTEGDGIEQGWAERDWTWWNGMGLDRMDDTLKNRIEWEWNGQNWMKMDRMTMRGYDWVGLHETRINWMGLE